jgi:hypothetical protein
MYNVFKTARTDTMKKWIWRIFLVLLALHMVLTVLVVPYLIRTKVPQIVGEMTGGTLQVEKAYLNPFVLNLEVRGIRFYGPEEAPLLTLRRIDVNLDVVHLLWGRLAIEYLGIHGPKLYIVQEKDGRFNFDWLMQHLEAKQSSEAAPEESGDGFLRGLSLKVFELDDGSVDFTDLSRPEPLHLQIEPVGLTLTGIDTRGKGRNAVHFYAGTGSGGVLDVKGTIRAFDPVAMHGEVAFDAGKLYPVYHFLQSISTLELADGRVQINLAYDVDLSDLNATKVDDINLSLRRLRIASKTDHSDVLRIGALSAAAGPVYPLRSEANVRFVTVDDLYGAFERLGDGSFSWQHFLTDGPEEGAAASEANRTDEAVRAPWDVRIERLAFNGAKVRFEDRTLARPAVTTLDDLNLSLSPVSTDLTLPIHIENRFALNGSGRVDVNASVVPEPLHAEANLSAEGLQLVPFDPYLEEGTYARIEAGSVSATGRLRFAPSKTDANLSARGDFGLEGLNISDARDAKPLVAVSALAANDYVFELAPDRLFVDAVTMDGFFADVLIDRNKTLNFAALMKPVDESEAAEKGSEAEASGGAEPFPVRIVRFDVTNGAVHFADDSLPLPFDTHIHDVNGQVLGISSLREDTTFLRLDGEIDRYGTAKAEGSLNTGDPKAFTDIGVVFRNIDLKSYTPYSGKFVGRAIDQGKLFVTLRYRIVDGKMKGDNGLVINKIVLGKEIKSSDAISLPLDFAIALLEDRDGVIDIDMPVEGDVDNPKFRWGGVVWKAFVNLLTKAVTAPFNLIGALLGVEGETLKKVPFEPGRAEIDAVSRERLDLLAKALTKRPRLAITVRGSYDGKHDGRALRRRALIQEVLGSDAEATVGAEEALVPGLLEPLYEKRLGGEALAKLKEEVASTDADEETQKRIYGEKLIEAMIETQPLPADALDVLAQARARAVRSYLMVNHAVEAGRIKEESPLAVRAEKGFVATQIGLDAVK